jgi:hypothetical protein
MLFGVDVVARTEEKAGAGRDRILGRTDSDRAGAGGDVPQVVVWERIRLPIPILLAFGFA